MDYHIIKKVMYNRTSQNLLASGGRSQYLYQEEENMFVEQANKYAPLRGVAGGNSLVQN